jgi:hypothetical protein
MVLSKWTNLEHEEDEYNEIYFKLSTEQSLPNYVSKYDINWNTQHNFFFGLELE